MESDPPKNINQSIDIPSLSIRKSSTSNQCDICFEQYHVLGKWPMIACANHHSFCDICIEGLLSRNNYQPVPCPICRSLIRKSLIRPNRDLFSNLNHLETVRKAIKQTHNQLFLYAFQHEIFEIARIFKQNRLQDLKLIQKLQLSQRKINKIENLLQLKALTLLQLQNNRILSLKGLQQLSNLVIVNISHNLVQQIDNLGKLKKLESLAAEYNKIKSVDLTLFNQLKHLFLYENPIGQFLADQLLMIDFNRLITLSFSIQSPLQSILCNNFIQSLLICENLPCLKRLFIREILIREQCDKLQNFLYSNNKLIDLIWISKDNQEQHEYWMNIFHKNQDSYGQFFKFEVDPASPFINQYRIQDKKITKLSSNFTSINSSKVIQKQGKQSFKIKIVQPSQHFIMGICNGFVKHTSNIYSEHFVGLAFWGYIYSRGESLPVSSKLRIQQKPTICLSIDFDQEMIYWFSDETEVGKFSLPRQFRFSELYFVLGMRDKDTAALLLES